MNKRKVLRGCMCLSAGLLAFFIFGRVITEEYKNYIDSALGTISSEVVTPEDEETNTEDLYTYKSQYKSTDELIAADKALGTRVGEEGTILLKNKSNALPLSKSSKVSLLGNAAYSSLLGGNIGSGASDNSRIGYSSVNFVDAVEEKIGSDNVNPDLETAFTTDNKGSYWLGMNFAPVSSAAAWECNEPTIETLESHKSGCTNSYGDYTDAAFVVLSRVNAEGSNMTPGNVKADDFTESANKNPLSLADEEKALIKNAKAHADKVIVVLNANNPLELTELNEEGGDYEADAIVWCGTPGVWGMRGVANVLFGDASPSGKTVDTFASNSALAPAAINTNIYWYDNYDEKVSLTDGTNYNGYIFTNGNGSAETLRAVAYEVEAEGIYTGYKYYETRYYDSMVSENNLGDNAGAKSATASTSTSGWDYDNEVCYPFGYGLSYASFTQTLDSVDVDLKNATVTAQVTVTRSENDGYSGTAMDVVEFYVQSPYTQYDVTNKVEKSAIQLLDYEKTGALKAGESETITITADMKYMASYDYTNAKTYILDDGDYYFGIGNGAHEALQNIMAKQNVTGVSGDSAKADMWNNKSFDDETFATSENGTKITNALDDADLNYYQEGKVTYLSRSDWDGTFPVEYTGTNQVSITDNMVDQLRNRTYEIQTNSMVTTTWDKDSGLKLADVKDNDDIDDELYTFLVEQLSIEDAVEAIERGGGTTETIDSIQNPRCPQSDGPNGFNGSSIGQNTTSVMTENGLVDISNDSNKGYGFGTMANAPVIAATWSKDVATAVGIHYGEEGLWCGNSILWGSCGQLHRNAYCGREHEYYSEDAMLTCYMNQYVIAGSRTMGLINGPKHLAFNNSEYCRYGLSTFFNEQAARENELRGFQGGFEDGGALAVMGGFNRVGITYSNAHTGLMQNILRGEWGFKGILSTDMADHTYLQSAADCIMASTTMIANSADTYTAEGKIWNNINASKVANDSAFLEQLQQNMRYEWYAYANSNAMNGMNSNSYIVNTMTWWRALFIAGITVFAVLLAASVVLYVLNEVKGKKDSGSEAKAA